MEFDFVLGDAKDEVYSFWRPRAPSGYAIFGDFLTPMFVIDHLNIFAFFFLLMGHG